MLIIPANSAVSGGFDVANSLRFNRGSSDSLSFTPDSTTNRKTFTISFWTKIAISNIGGSEGGVFNAGQQPNDNGWFNIQQGHTSDGDFMSQFYSGAFRNFKLTQQIRDTSAWYHFVVAMDTTQGTDTNRLKYYINGTQVTAFSSPIYPDQNFDTKVSTNEQIQSIGSKRNGSAALTDFFDGYLSEFIMIDGQQLAPDQFGEFDEDTGIWKPIDVSGLTFGDNGYYLEFKQSGTSQNSSGLGADTSGNDNHFAVTNLTAVDQSIDTCTNNFATLNPLAGRNNPNAYYATFSEGNLKLVGNSSTNNGNAFSTMGFNSGKWYCEVKMVDADNSLFPIVGVITEAEIVSANSPSNSGQIGTTIAGTVGYSPDGQKIVAGTESSYGNTFTNNDIIGIAIDCDNGAVYFSKNGTFQASGNPTSGSSRTNAAVTFTPSTNYFFGASVYKDTNDIDFNFGSPPFAISSGNTDGNGFGNFEYAVPSGYFSLNTKNLAEYG